MKNGNHQKFTNIENAIHMQITTIANIRMDRAISLGKGTFLPCTYLRTKFNYYYHQQFLQSEVFSCGLLIRDLETNSMICDFPVESIEYCEIVGKDLILVVPLKSDMIALKLEDAKELLLLAVALRDNGIACNDHECKTAVTDFATELSIPDLEDPGVQEFALRLLFSHKFRLFVNKLDILITKFGESIALDTLMEGSEEFDIRKFQSK